MLLKNAQLSQFDLKRVGVKVNSKALNNFRNQRIAKTKQIIEGKFTKSCGKIRGTYA